VTRSNQQQKNFFATLFDFNFTSFITLRFLKVIYGILVALILLGGAVFFFSGLASRTGLGVVFALVVAPLATLAYLIMTRISLEVIAMFFRIGDNTALTVQLLGGGNQMPQGGYPPPYGYAAPPGGPVPWGGPTGSPFAPDPALQYGQPTTGYPPVPPSGPYEGPVPPAPPRDASGHSEWGPTTPSH
jgi:hypothetical protein